MNLSPDVIEAKEDLFFGEARDQNHPPTNFSEFSLFEKLLFIFKS
jgi:hypothetical protein